MSAHNDELKNYRRRRHSISRLVVHLIFTTKYRRQLLDETMIQQTREAFLSAAAMSEF